MKGRPWTQDDNELLRRHYADGKSGELAAMLGRTLPGVYSQARKLGISKSQAYLESGAGRIQKGKSVSPATQFRPGHKTWNKGMKGLQRGGQAGWFRKNQMPHNHVSVGTIVADFEGYLKKKIGEPRQWRYLHRLTWEEAHGPIPKGMALVFRDGNRQNCALENLELLTRQELMRRNSVHNLPQPIVDVIRMRAGLMKIINHRSKQHGKSADN